jgi:hypothetical protein
MNFYLGHREGAVKSLHPRQYNSGRLVVIFCKPKSENRSGQKETIKSRGRNLACLFF